MGRSGYTIGRALVAVISLLGGRSYAWTVDLTGASGAVVLVVPDLYRRFASALLYARSDAIEWVERFTTAGRIIGAVHVILAAKAYRNRSKNA